jgi:tRNA-splicing ligase RtcB
VAGIIPGTSGTPSYLVEGLGNQESLESSSHGAGRPFSRTEAKRRHNEALVKMWMKEQDVLSFGLAPDETFMAYKDIDHVMALQTELVRTVARMWPKVVIMGGKSDDGD